MMKVYMRDIVTLRIAQTDKWGTKTFTNRNVRARIDEGSKIVRDFSGEQVVSSAQITIETTSLTHKDKVRYDSTDHTIIRIDEPQDFKRRFMVVSVA